MEPGQALVEEVDVIVGKHVYANLYGVEEAKLSDAEFLRQVVIDAVRASNTTLVDVKVWRFGGRKGGVSVLALLVESHIALHTWPAYRYATVDIYTCGARSDPWKAFEVILNALRPETYSVYYADRSSRRSPGGSL